MMQQADLYMFENIALKAKYDFNTLVQTPQPEAPIPQI
jgi:hypothetical protein